MSKAKKHETNVEFITRVMEYSDCGPVMQALVVHLLCQSAKTLANTPLAEIQKAFGPNYLISPDAWHEAARELHSQLSAKYGA